MTDRNVGNPNARAYEREEGRIGRERTPADIPKQTSKTRFTDEPGNVGSHTPAATYSAGVAQRPKSIKHDDGFLSLGKRAPKPEDYAKLAKWKLMLEGGEALRPDLVDALAAYRHFLQGNGQSRIFSYDRYVMNDEAGKITLHNAILDIQQGAIEYWKNNGKPNSYMITGTEIQCSAGSVEFPYPHTENWQKAIGAHVIWISGTVTVTMPATAIPRFKLIMTLHAEDRYNFNPGQADIVTGIPDSDNGIFEMTGLGHQYDHFSTLVRVITWEGTSLGVISASGTKISRDRQPQDNRRLRNRI